ncbi:hypothetical protein ACVPOS_14635 [Staphylococcus aureus]
MKSYLSMFTKNIQIYQLIIIKFKRLNSNIDETNLTYICTTNSEQSWQAYDYVFLTCNL